MRLRPDGRRSLRIAGAPPLRTPGPRKEEQAWDLPARVPPWYCLRHPRAYAAVFVPCGGFCAALALWSLSDGAWAVSLCFLAFAAGAFGAMALVRRESVQCLGDRLLCRPIRGPEREIRFEDVAAVRIKTWATGIGPISGVQLLGRNGEVLLSPSVGMKNTPLLLADLAGRGIPFTY